MADVNPWIALGGTVFGGAGLKIIERLLIKSKEKDDTALQMREELRQEVKALRESLYAVEKELTSWRDKYYKLLEINMTLKGLMNAITLEVGKETVTTDLLKSIDSIDPDGID